MPEIEIRPAIFSDITALMALEHFYISDHVWQMEAQYIPTLSFTADEGPTGESVRTVSFRQVRLPRSVRVDYPRSPRTLADDWTSRSGLLVALLEGQPIGYVSLVLNNAPLTAWATDLVVERRLRRKGIGSALVLAAQEWAGHMQCQHVILEMQPKNYPAIQLALKLGFELCGFNDRYYANHEIGIFFAKSLR